MIRTCATCKHDGCCEDIPYCGGIYWSPDEDNEPVLCANCEQEIDPGDEVEIDGELYCPDCADEISNGEGGHP